MNPFDDLYLEKPWLRRQRARRTGAGFLYVAIVLASVAIVGAVFWIAVRY